MSQPGWYPDPHSSPGQLRWWDGYRWTPHVQGPEPAYRPPAMLQPRRASTGLHVVLTLLTCGAWLPVWLIAEWWAARQAAAYRRYLEAGGI